MTNQATIEASTTNANIGGFFDQLTNVGRREY